MIDSFDMLQRKKPNVIGVINQLLWQEIFAVQVLI